MWVDVTEDLQEVKNQQASPFASEASKVIFWSRVHTMEQDETCSRTMSESMRKGVNILIYKQKGEREEIRNWQPISLLNADYKILSKVIASQNNLREPRTSQGYVQDSGVDACLISLDQEKAFDRVSHIIAVSAQTHEHLQPVLTGLGAKNKELTLTEYCRLADSNVEDYLLRDALKLGAVASK
eukprot:g41904.t1